MAAWWWLNHQNGHDAQPALLTNEGYSLSRFELSAAVRAAAFCLAGHGVRRHDRLALLMAAGPEMACSLLAGMSVATVAPLVPTAPQESLLVDLSRLKVTHVLVDVDPPGALLAAASRLDLPVIRLNPLALPAVAAADGPRPADQDLALLLQTSGTTSQPKVVPLTHSNLWASACSVAEVLALGPMDRSLAAMPLFHIHGIVACMLAPLLAGGSVICCRRNTPEAVLAAMESQQPTWMSAVPTLLQCLLAELDRRQTPLLCPQLRLLRSSSSPLPPAVLQRLEAVFRVPVIEAYGMTEAAHQICSNRLPGAGPTRQPGSVGLAAGPEVVVLGPDHQPRPVGERGEVAIRGVNITAGYEGSETGGWVGNTAGGRWFLTGDEGYLDAEGRLSLTGRLKEMINRGGVKVIPRRVDEALLQHPAVEQALAFAIPHATLGEDLAAAVVLRPGAQEDEQNLRRHAFALLAPHEVPSRVVLLDELPWGATGKPQRIGLATKLAQLLQPGEDPASGELEELVAQIMANVLQQPTPGRHANFFLLGGDSLSGQRVVSSLEQQLALELTPSLLFEYPSVRSLAERLDQLLDQALAGVERLG
ncbi:MAG: non-ribosomal peptide synthetase [Synechococcaceae cyanobacterium]|nr:non-ribosomal peptide synthetase [Synechococcaceae cyanobacterium]